MGLNNFLKNFQANGILKKSKTFCVLPWTQIATRPDGAVNLCCLATNVVFNDERQQPLRMDRDEFKKIWNCSDLKEIRKKMLEGKRIKGCEVCYIEENNNRKSLRRTSNEKWLNRLGKKEIQNRLAQSLVDGELKSPPVYFDLRLGNKCNLKCRMCFPINSHGINEEIIRIREMNLNFPEFYKTQKPEEKKLFEWGDNEKFLKSLETILPHAQEFYFTGGEPMLIKGTYDLLKKACDLKASSKIRLTFHTNTMLWNKNLISLLPAFKEVSLICSIDGIGTTEEYIRYPARFNVLDENFRKYLQLTQDHNNILLSIGSTISWQNIFDLPRMASWLVDHKLENYPGFRLLYFNPVYFPSFLSFKMIPEPLKKAAAESVHQSIEVFRKGHFLNPNLESNLLSLIEVLKQDSAFNENESRELVSHTEALDQLRNQSLLQMIPSAHSVYAFHKELNL